MYLYLEQPVFPQHLKSGGFREGCWYPEHKENMDNHIEFGGAARNMDSEVKSLFHWKFGCEKPSYWGFWDF